MRGFFRTALALLWITNSYQTSTALTALQSQPAQHGSTQNLHIICLVPLTGGLQDIGNSVKIAIEDALYDVNSNISMLPGFKLVVEWVDSQCDMAVATKSIFDVLHSQNNTVYVYGGYCNSVTKYIAESVSYFNLWQISFANTDPTLSDSATYQNFLRVIPNELDFNMVWMHFLHVYNWTKVALLFQDASSGVSTYAYTNNDMVSLLKEVGAEFITESVTDNSVAALSRVNERDYRIFIGSFDHVMAAKTICLCFHLGMYGYKYVWLLSQSFTYPHDWWRNADNCSDDQMENALHGHFAINITASTSHALYYRGAYGSYAYDGVWLMANSLGRFIQSSKPAPPDWVAWRNITDSSVITGDGFPGHTGDVRFSGRRRLGYLNLYQRQDGDYMAVGQLDMNRDILNLYAEKISWHGHSQAPTDRITIETRLIKPNIYIRTALLVLASLGLILASSFLAINIKYASHRHIKMSSPNMNNVIVVGCILIYCSTFILRVDPSSTALQIVCIARTWVLSLGFSLSFGALFAKTWRVYTIFNSIHAASQKKMITDRILFGIIIGLIAVDLVVLIIWAAVDPLKVEEQHLAPIEDVKEHKQINRIIFTCESKMTNIWAAITYTYKGLLLVVGVFLAWQTRHVNLPALNDSKYIGMSVYNVVIMCTSAVAISYVIHEQDYSDLIVGLLVILCTTITLCLVFVPKIMHLRKDPKGIKPRPRLSMSASSRKSKVPTRPSKDNLKAIELKIAQLEQEMTVNQSKVNSVTEELDNLKSTHKLSRNHSCTASSLGSDVDTTTIVENLSPPPAYGRKFNDYARAKAPTNLADSDVLEVKAMVCEVSSINSPTARNTRVTLHLETNKCKIRQQFTTHV